MTPVVLEVNGTIHEVVCDPDTPLLYVLRNDLVLVGAKFGYGCAPSRTAANVVAAMDGD